MMKSQKFCELAAAVIDNEAKSIAALKPRLDKSFSSACEHLLACEGRIVVLGMGKSGHIGGKIAATFASTGSPAFFVNAAEASHGDLGMITRKDVVVAISNSGKTPEIMTILPIIKRLGIPMITLTGNPDSILAKAATVNLDISVEEEACPLGLAPTSSTTTTLVMGDALAVALLDARGFTANDFALSHPGGTLGKRLLLRINDVMRTGAAIPTVSKNTLLNKALIEMSAKRLGMTAVLEESGELIGIFTDGDLRRTIDKGLDVHATPVSDVMTVGCKTIPMDSLAAEALDMMETYKITTLMITDEKGRPTGVVHMHDLLEAGVA